MNNLELFSPPVLFLIALIISNMFHIQYKNDGEKYFLWDFYILSSKIKLFISLVFNFQRLPSLNNCHLEIWLLWSLTVWWCNFHKRARFVFLKSLKYSSISFLTSCSNCTVIFSCLKVSKSNFKEIGFSTPKDERNQHAFDTHKQMQPQIILLISYRLLSCGPFKYL